MNKNAKRAALVMGQSAKARALSHLAETMAHAFHPIPEKYSAVLTKEISLLQMADNQINVAKQTQAAAMQRLSALSMKITAESK